jgi:hypothetical protein
MTHFSLEEKYKGSDAAAFVLGLLAGGAKLCSTVFEQGEQHGFTAKQLRAARERGGFVAAKQPKTRETVWWWTLPGHEAAWRQSFEPEQQQPPEEPGQQPSGPPPFPPPSHVVSGSGL